MNLMLHNYDLAESFNFSEPQSFLGLLNGVRRSESQGGVSVLAGLALACGEVCEPGKRLFWFSFYLKHSVT